MRSFKLFSKSRNIMPKNPEKLSREDTKRITENVENRLGLSDARPRLGGGPVMAALTAMAMIAVMVAGGIYIAGKDVMVVDPATNSYNTTVINGNVEFASDYIYCNMYLGSDMTSIEIELPYIYTEHLPYMTVTGFFGSNTDGVTINTVDNSSMGSESDDDYNMGAMRLTVNIPWSSGKEVRIDSLTVDIDGVGENIAVKFGEPLRFHCVDAVKDDNMQVIIKREIKSADTIQNDVKITSTDYRKLENIYMLTGEPLVCYEKNNTSYSVTDRTSDSEKTLEFCNIITEGGDLRLDKSAELCYIYANALLEVTDSSGSSYYVIAEVDNSNTYNGLSDIPEPDKLKEDILSSETTQQVTQFEMDSLAGNAYSQRVIDTLEGELSLSQVGQSSIESTATYMTVDSVLCDGVTANILLLIEPGDAYAEDMQTFRDAYPTIKFETVDGKKIDAVIRKNVYGSERGGKPIKCVSISVDIDDFNNDINPVMIVSTQQDSSGIVIDLDRNINMNEYRSADGESVYLSECAFYNSFEYPTNASDGAESFTLIDYSGGKSTYTAKKFGLEYYETYNTVSIEYNGKIYTKKGA